MRPPPGRTDIIFKGQLPAAWFQGVIRSASLSWGSLLPSGLLRNKIEPLLKTKHFPSTIESSNRGSGTVVSFPTKTGPPVLMLRWKNYPPGR